jgi:hypothetical protein
MSHGLNDLGSITGRDFSLLINCGCPPNLLFNEGLFMFDYSPSSCGKPKAVGFLPYSQLRLSGLVLNPKANFNSFLFAVFHKSTIYRLGD